jgi:hypothetical protein
MLRVVIQYKGINLNGEDEVRVEAVQLREQRAPRTTAEYMLLKKHISDHYSYLVEPLIISWHELGDD